MTRNRQTYKSFDTGNITVAVGGPTTIYTSEVLDATYRELGLHIDNTDANALDVFTLQVEIAPNAGFEDYIAAWGTENRYVVRATETMEALPASTVGVASVLLPPCNRVRIIGSSVTGTSAVRVYGAYGRI